FAPWPCSLNGWRARPHRSVIRTKPAFILERSRKRMTTGRATQVDDFGFQNLFTLAGEQSGPPSQPLVEMSARHDKGVPMRELSAIHFRAAASRGGTFCFPDSNHSRPAAAMNGFNSPINF